MADQVTEDRGTSEPKVEDASEVFDTAFSEAEGTGEKAAVSVADDPANVSNEPEKPAEPEVPAEPVAETPPAPPAPTPDPLETAEQRYRTLQGILRHEKEQWEAEKAQLTAQIETVKTAQVPTPPATPEPAMSAFIESLTDEQKTQLEEYEQDFDVVSKMEGLKRSMELGKLRKEFDNWKAEIATQISAHSTQLEPVVSQIAEQERVTHFNTIRSGYTREDGSVVPGHPDFEKFRDDGSVLAWIESKPKYLQPALKDAYSQGTSQDVVDLFHDFKREQNIPITPNRADNVVPMNPATAIRKQALTAVNTRRGAVATGTAIADDYEGAFEEALNK